VFEISVLFIRIADFLQLKEPSTLFYLFILMSVLYMGRNKLVCLDVRASALEKEVIRLNGVVVKNEAVIASQDHREDMQKKILAQTEARHTQYRKDMSEINSRIDRISDAKRDCS
jgi:hypothetical protein